jgi:hypothetical protein
LGVWAGLIAFVGPYFNYAMHSDQTWQWFADRGWLQVLPAAATVIGGFMLMSGATRARNSLGAMIALAGGLWFLIGPTVSMLWNHGSITVGPPIGAHNITHVLEWLGFFYGVGALITLFSAYALGFMAALPIVDERIVGRTVATGGAGAGAGAAAGFAAGRVTAPRREQPVASDAPTETAPATTSRTGTRRTGGLFRRRARETDTTTRT